MLDELIAEQQYRQAREANRERLAMEAEARELFGEAGVRERLAGALVTLGGWLDARAIERASRPAAAPRARGLGR